MRIGKRARGHASQLLMTDTATYRARRRFFEPPGSLEAGGRLPISPGHVNPPPEAPVPPHAITVATGVPMGETGGDYGSDAESVDKGGEENGGMPRDQRSGETGRGDPVHA
jgi:hypothetical protein